MSECLFRPDPDEAWLSTTFSSSGQMMVAASLHQLDLYDTSHTTTFTEADQALPGFNRIAHIEFYGARCITWAPDERHFIAIGRSTPVIDVFEVSPNNEVKLIYRSGTQVDFGWFPSNNIFMCFYEGFLGFPNPGAVLSTGQIGSDHLDNQELESHEVSQYSDDNKPISAYAQNILTLAKKDVVKVWLVDRSRTVAPLLGTYRAVDKVQDMRISPSGKWLITLDILGYVDIHNIDLDHKNFTRLFRLDYAQPSLQSRINAIVGLTEASSPIKQLIVAVSDTINHVTVHEVGSEVREIGAADGELAVLSANGTYLYTAFRDAQAGPWREGLLQNQAFMITPIGTSQSPHIISLESFWPNRMDASPTDSLLLAWRSDTCRYLGSWQLSLGKQ